MNTAIITGFIARSQIKQGKAAGDGMAIAGIICGFATFVLMGLWGLLLALRVGGPLLQQELGR